MSDKPNQRLSGEYKGEALGRNMADLHSRTPLAIAQIGLDRNVRRLGSAGDRAVEEYAELALDTIAKDFAEGASGSGQQCFDKVIDTGQPYQHVESFRPGGDSDLLRTLNYFWYPIFDRTAKVAAVGVIVEDISIIEQREATLQHIARELQHRVKNTLANVIALVEQAERSAMTSKDALTILKRRVIALSATHSRLTESNWGPTPLRAILEQEMTEVYGPAGIRLDGPDILMTAQSALAFSMGLHEMMANAAAYGGLSAERGRVELKWRIDSSGENGGWVHFDWKETGGPHIDEEFRDGFGHRLIDASLRTSLRGKMERLWEEDGLRYRFSLPLALVTGS